MKKISITSILRRISFALLAAVLCATGAHPNAYAQIGYDDYATNDVLFYDPTDSPPCTATSGTGAATTNVDGADNAEKIYNYMVAKGLSGAQAAGILGNLQQESNFNPAIIQGGQIADANYTPVNGVGFGLAQWTFTPRQQPLVDLAKSTNRKVIDITVQLDYLWKELNTTHAHSLTSLKAASTPEDAAYFFHRDFEGSADSEAFVKQVRGGNARQWYEKFDGAKDTGGDPKETGGNASSDTVSCGESGSGGIGDYTADGFTLYNQCDAPWGQIAVPSPDGTACQVSCGPTSMAMIIKNMTGKDVTPTDTVNYTSKNNLWYGTGGTTPQANVQIGENWGVRGENIPRNDFAGIKTAIKNGGLVMIAGRGATPFLTSVNHWVVIRGFTDDGKAIVADPNGKSGNYDYNTLIGDSYDAWAFYKK